MTIKSIETAGFLPSHCSRMERTNLLQSGPMMWTLDKSDSISFFYAIGIDTCYQVNLFDIKITFCVSRSVTGQHGSWFFFDPQKHLHYGGCCDSTCTVNLLPALVTTFYTSFPFINRKF